MIPALRAIAARNLQGRFAIILAIKVGMGLKVATLPVGLAHAQAELAPDVLAALDCLRVAVTLFDPQERLTYCSQHFDYIFRALPDRELLQGKTYEELIRMELASGEISTDSISGGADGFVAPTPRAVSCR